MSLNTDITLLAHSVAEEAPPDYRPHLIRFKPGDRVGPYRLIFRVGQGGMGDVYTADRADNLYRRRVALKLMRARLDGPDMTGRFDAERRILASLDHPNISKLVDGGMTEHGVPYVVMEYVDGLPLDEYCKSRKLPIDERIHLFLKVCSAVQYAHRNLIVHRDIKPDNILVNEDGQPILLDFGIAKLLRPELMGMMPSETSAGAQMMTPEFASPEQFLGKRVSTASDVYSLGALAYLLVSGRLPHPGDGLSTVELGRLVCDVEPSPPTPRDATAPADLDAIILKALRKEPESRYLSVEEMAADLRRYLDGFAVQARQGNWQYRTTKFLRRQRVAAAFSTVLALVLIASSIILISFGRSLKTERDLAAGSMDFMWQLLDGADPNGSHPAQTTAARQLLDEASKRLLDNNGKLNSSTLRPEVRAMLTEKIGDVYNQLGAYDRAEPMFALSLQLIDKLGQSESGDAARVHVRMADLLRHLDQYDRAEQEARRSLEIRVRRFGRKHEQVADSLNVTGILLQIRGKATEAEAVFREAVEIRRKVLKADDPLLALSISNLGNMLRDKDDFDGARSSFEEALSIRRKAFGNDHPKVGSSLLQLGKIATLQKRFDDAVTLSTEGVRLARKAYPPDHPDLGSALGEYGKALATAGRFAQSEPVLLEALEIQRKANGLNSIPASFAEAALAATYIDLKRYHEAEPLQQHAVAIRQQKLGSKHRFTLGAKAQLGDLLLRLAKPTEAAVVFQAVLASNDDPAKPHMVKAKQGLAKALFH